MSRPSRGPRPAGADTRGDILKAAQECFSERGFDAATIRAVAERAGVDPALVHHYFGTKRELFVEALGVPLDVDILSSVLGPIPRDQAGAAVLRHIVPIWDGEARPRVIALLRTALGDARNSTAIQSMLIEGPVTALLRSWGVPEGEIPVRAALMESVVLGILSTRLVLEVPSIRDLTVDQLVEVYAPTFQRFISAPLDELVPSPTTG